ncbi:MAG: hypothetical protein ACTSVF_01370 [Candidatus Asgardarchaeia archaeon]
MNRYELAVILGFFLFPVLFTILVPVVYEMWHVLLLRFFGCPYSMKFYFHVIFGFSARIDYTCVLSKLSSGILLLSGHIGNILIGLFLYSISYLLATKTRFCASVFLSIISLPFIFSSSYYFILKEPDFMNFLALINVKNELVPIVAGFLLFSISFFLFWKNLEYTSEGFFVKVELKKRDQSET